MFLINFFAFHKSQNKDSMLWELFFIHIHFNEVFFLYFILKWRNNVLNENLIISSIFKEIRYSFALWMWFFLRTLACLSWKKHSQYFLMLSITTNDKFNCMPWIRAAILLLLTSSSLPFFHSETNCLLFLVSI